jgi:Dyp-type peroxidase family
MPSRWIPLHQIQGNVSPGFRKDHQAFLFFQFPATTFEADSDDASGAGNVRGWLKAILPTIASGEEVATYNRLYRLVKRRAAGLNPLAPLDAGDSPREGVQQFATTTWVNVAFTARGLAPLLRSEPWRADQSPSPWLQAFGQGMSYRDAITGDTLADIAGFGVRDTIRLDLDHLNVTPVDQQKTLVHAVVIVGADSERALRREVSRQIDMARANELAAPIELYGTSLGTGREPFGFADGISQPDADDPLAGWESDGAQTVAPGEIIRGCTPEPGHEVPGDVPIWERYGSYLVFRQLEQNVDGFWAEAQRAAEIMFRALVSGPASRPEYADVLTPGAGGKPSPGASYAAALMLGRWPSGATLTAPLDPKQFPSDPAGDERASGEMTALTGRDFAGDPLGATCPMFAHIRKSNPRVPTSSLKASDLSLHRIVRRGIPYVDNAGAVASRGIMFLAYQARIDEGFEFIQDRWSKNPLFGRPASGGEMPGVDPISVSTTRPNNRVIVPLRKGAAAGTFASVPSARTVTARGGGYFFAPSLTALDMLANDRFHPHA